jgi:hypothetical protein
VRWRSGNSKLEGNGDRTALSEHIGDEPYHDLLLNIWDSVHDVAPFAFRIVDEIKAYVAAADELGSELDSKLDLNWKTAFDEQVLQKILPKFRGNSDGVGDVLQNLVKLSEDHSLPLTQQKAERMLTMYNQHGFTSYF